MIEHAREVGMRSQAAAVEQVVEEILARPEHVWFEEGAEEAMAQIREEMERRYGGDETN